MNRKQEIEKMMEIIEEASRKHRALCNDCNKKCETFDRYRFAAVRLFDSGFCSLISFSEKVSKKGKEYVEEWYSLAEKEEKYARARGIRYTCGRGKEVFESLISKHKEEIFKIDSEEKRKEIVFATETIFKMFQWATLHCHDGTIKHESFSECKQIAEDLILAGFGNKFIFLNSFLRDARKEAQNRPQFLDSNSHNRKYISGQKWTHSLILEAIEEEKENMEKKGIVKNRMEGALRMYV